jgi:transposase
MWTSVNLTASGFTGKETSGAAAQSGLEPFGALAQSFSHDYEAIKLALITPWSTSQCEGQICRVKLIKRLGYGRAKLDLLRQRVLHRFTA